jgi:uncharacterized protein (DUF1697 family)
LTRLVALLRGINVGGHRRIPMPDLRELLGSLGYEEVQTYVQSGNIVLRTELSPDQLGPALEGALAERFGFDDIPVIVRTHDELERIVALNPLGAIATEPKRHQVSFLSAAPAPEVVARLAEADVAPEALVIDGREIYTWHPDGIQRSKVASLLAEKRLGVISTARNWTTVCTLLRMAGE